MKIGILGINKPTGMTSFDVIRILKKKIGIKKIGHGGTLDPMADGVLPILIEEGTAFFDALLHSSKKYMTTIQLGIATDTDDKEGAIISQHHVPSITLEHIVACTNQLTGQIMQVPPQYSALKINGKRAYDLARDGQVVELQARPVMIHSWSNITYDTDTYTITAEIHCGSGTYIRSLGRDLAEMLGTVGHLSALRRTQSGGILLENTLSLDDFPEEWEEYIIKPEQAVDFLPSLEWIGSEEHLLNGKPLASHLFNVPPQKSGLHRLMYHNKIIALLNIEGTKISYRKNLAPFYKNNI